MGGGTAAPSEPAALGSGADAIPDVTDAGPGHGAGADRLLSHA